MNAKQVRAEPINLLIPEKCFICQKELYESVYGYIRYGTSAVCSRTCHETYEARYALRPRHSQEVF